MDLRKINLNLLLHFDTLLAERSVSKAAEKTFMTQTAMSHILKQLRELFNDSLFIRHPQGLQPTQRALELAPRIQEFLNCSNAVFREKTFDPQKEVLSFRAALAGHGEHLVLPRLCAYLVKNAPNCSLNTSPLSEYLSLDHLLATEIDFAIAPGFIDVGEQINAECLLEEEAACIMRKSHPLAKQELTQEKYLQAEQVDIRVSYLSNENILYKSLDDYRHRNIKVTVPDVINALEVVFETDLIATVPLKLAVFLKERYQFEVKSFPFPVTKFRINFYYHARLNNYKPLLWLIDVIKNNCFVGL
ncbi:Nodulation protein D 2 [Legionella massiliensis]|uniref:Nodulation protein D 2 n=1 Tax=Legionella massiliensis TaxID=1034943 RepID=A0A078KVH5_9GAMM|nr:LysR family transcriptional regulator [Legionella massiliensis]CDZ76997.1 Nodulation protein D 2 [Legionella massiliensis]CEE12735.1 Nodulation protein D 2 [Legionella massiliensis]